MSAEGLMFGAIAGNLAQARERIAQLEAEIRELKAWAGKNEGLMQAQDRVIEAVSKKVTELESENTELRKILWSAHGNHVRYGDDGEMQCNSCAIDFKRAPVEQLSESLRAVFAELRNDKERLTAEIKVRNKCSPVSKFSKFWRIGMDGEPIGVALQESINYELEAKCD